MKFVDNGFIFIKHKNLAFVSKERIGIHLAGFFIHEDNVSQRATLSRSHSYNRFLCVLRISDNTDNAYGNAKVGDKGKEVLVFLEIREAAKEQIIHSALNTPAVV